MMKTNVQASDIKKSVRRLPLALVTVAAFLAFIIVLFIDFIPSPFGGYADQRFFLIMVSGLLVISAVVSTIASAPVSARAAVPIVLPTMIFSLSFLLFSMPFYNLPYIWVEPGMYSFFFLATVSVGVNLTWSGSDIYFARLLVLIVAATCLVYGLASVTVYLFATFDGVTDLADFIPWGFVNIRYWSHIATWCLPLIPLAVLIGPLRGIRSWRIAVLLGAGMWWWILFLTTGRGSALGIVFGVMVSTLLFGRRAVPWLKQFLFYLGAGAFLWLLLSVAIPSFIAEEVQLRTVKADSSGRIPLFNEAWHMSLQNLPLGMGPQSWLTHETLTEAYMGAKKLGHPHNMYLMWAAEYGWGLMAALGLLVLQAIRCFWLSRQMVLAEVWSRGDDEKLLLLAGFTASVSAALFHAGVSAVFMAPGSMLVGLFVLIAFWALIIPSMPDSGLNSASSPIRRARVIIALVLGAVIMVAWLAWLSGVGTYYQDMRQDEKYYYENEGDRTLPRFWLHGNFPRH